MWNTAREPAPTPTPSTRRGVLPALATLCIFVLAACGSTPHAPRSDAAALPTLPTSPRASALPATPPASHKADGGRYFKLGGEQEAEEIVLYALGLLGTRYRYGGRDPESGLDCSGMVRYIVEQVAGEQLPHNAARIASMTRPIRTGELAPGDLVFFNTLGRKHSHMGIYLGNGQFVHAPSSGGEIRIAHLDNPYFQPRIDGARTLVSRP